LTGAVPPPKSPLVEPTGQPSLAVPLTFVKVAVRVYAVQHQARREGLVSLVHTRRTSTWICKFVVEPSVVVEPPLTARAAKDPVTAWNDPHAPEVGATTFAKFVSWSMRRLPLMRKRTCVDDDQPG
jgi:hypothetical protein